MHRLHSWQVGVAFLGSLIVESCKLFALPDAVYTTLVAVILFVAVVHNVHSIVNGERHESFVVVRNVYRRCVGK